MREITVQIFDDLDYATNGARHEARVTVAIGLDGVWRTLTQARVAAASVSMGCCCRTISA